MKSLAILFCVLLLTTTAVSQSRARTTKSSKPQTAAAAQAAARTAAATRVADEIKVLTKFLYVLGGVAKGIEQIDEAARKTEGSSTVLQQNEQNKASVRSSVRNIRERLDKLEIDFRGTPGLQSYYLKLAGSASGAATAEEHAAAGRFDQAGRTLLGVVDRLTDVLLIMR